MFFKCMVLIISAAYAYPEIPEWEIFKNFPVWDVTALAMYTGTEKRLVKTKQDGEATNVDFYNFEVEGWPFTLSFRYSMFRRAGINEITCPWFDSKHSNFLGLGTNAQKANRIRDGKFKTHFKTTAVGGGAILQPGEQAEFECKYYFGILLKDLMRAQNERARNWNERIHNETFGEYDDVNNVYIL